MRKETVEHVLESIVEELAAIEHERWSHWQRYVHEKGTQQSDGSLVIPAELVERWERQMETPYAKLSPNEKESDREQVRKYLPTVKKAIEG